MKRAILSLVGCLLITTQVYAGEQINQNLPDWVEVDVQFRHRLEYRDNFNFNDSADDTDVFHLIRTRINLLLKPIEKVDIFAQFQDARVANQDNGSKVGNENWSDLRQIYIHLKKIYDFKVRFLNHVSLKFGRQELSYGKQRLLGGFNWSNVAQTFDAGKIRLFVDSLDVWIDAFGGVKTPNNSPREFDDLYNVHETRDQVRGYYAGWTGGKNVTIEHYLINRKTNKGISFGPSGSGELEEFTVGGRIEGKIPDTGFDYEIEGAWQGGDFGTQTISAGMAVAIVGYTFEDVPWDPRAAFEFNYASGDSDSSDGDRNTFDNLYPTNHLYYGYMDRISLQNLNNYHFQIAAKPTKKLKLQGDVHLIYLDTSKDALYSAGRGVLRTASTAGVSEHVGNEIDLLAKYKLNDHTDVMVGYSHFFAGKFLEETGANDDGDFVYWQTTVSF